MRVRDEVCWIPVNPLELPGDSRYLKEALSARFNGVHPMLLTYDDFDWLVDVRARLGLGAEAERSDDFRAVDRLLEALTIHEVVQVFLDLSR